MIRFPGAAGPRPGDRRSDPRCHRRRPVGASALLRPAGAHRRCPNWTPCGNGSTTPTPARTCSPSSCSPSGQAGRCSPTSSALRWLRRSAVYGPRASGWPPRCTASPPASSAPPPPPSPARPHRPRHRPARSYRPRPPQSTRPPPSIGRSLGPAGAAQPTVMAQADPHVAAPVSCNTRSSGATAGRHRRPVPRRPGRLPADRRAQPQPGRPRPAVSGPHRTRLGARPARRCGRPGSDPARRRSSSPNRPHPSRPRTRRRPPHRPHRPPCRRPRPRPRRASQPVPPAAVTAEPSTEPCRFTRNPTTTPT